ncbi:NAD-dependent epimerase/dehydratase family protein [Actinotalea sp. M2MS4P-6]|uniref:NAD-dependent epimerase/dehydratase family protein n=1 Tax=Actinotalea sp. M2MS4P-6 TaxID=2983762 RepID=UPI0021E45727|nr:NAD-dependent epimerase/dehydratase family protein [Actinotalea sp. M2MS4P-6]MCV2393296.1 NAD-dependent epimerase/dehydratase family protein [Actinotalea sp. M2MS4P-6]
MEILVLGGTVFLGREIAQVALRRGHSVTCLARGTAPAPDGARFVPGDRDQDAGLAGVTNRTWDAVIDVSRHPGQVRRAVRDLTTGRWVFVSTASVYADAARVEQGEDAAVLEPLDGDVMTGPDVYGNAKVACEDAVRAAAAPATVVRPGLIGGPGDRSARSGYWPWRFAHPSGDDVIVPDDPDQPCALIDVRDLADWIVTTAEDHLDGTFNVTGPTLPLAEALATAAQVGASSARTRPVPPQRLRELGVGSWMGPRSLPLWIDDPDSRGLATLDTTRARAAGLRTRPLAETLRDALAYEERRIDARPAGLTDDEERRVRAALDGT